MFYFTKEGILYKNILETLKLCQTKKKGNFYDFTKTTK